MVYFTNIVCSFPNQPIEQLSVENLWKSDFVPKHGQCYYVNIKFPPENTNFFQLVFSKWIKPIANIFEIIEFGLLQNKNSEAIYWLTAINLLEKKTSLFQSILIVLTSGYAEQVQNSVHVAMYTLSCTILSLKLKRKYKNNEDIINLSVRV